MKRRLILVVLVAIGLGAIAWLGSEQLSLSKLAQREHELRQVITDDPVQSWLLGFLIYFLVALVPGTRGKAIVWGWLFGFWSGLVLVNLALTAAAITAFFASRHLLRELVETRYSAQLAWANRALERDGAFYVLALRVVPVSFSITNYLLGASAVNSKTYWWSTQLGLLPGNIAFVFVGAGLPSLRQIAEQGLLALFSWQLMFGLVLLSLLPFAAHWVVQRLRTYQLTIYPVQSPSVK